MCAQAAAVFQAAVPAHDLLTDRQFAEVRSRAHLHKFQSTNCDSVITILHAGLQVVRGFPGIKRMLAPYLRNSDLERAIKREVRA